MSAGEQGQVMALLAGRVFASGTRPLSAAGRRRIFVAGNLAALPAILGALAAGRALTRISWRLPDSKAQGVT